MVEYSVMLIRHKGSTRPNVCIFRDENREAAIREMHRYGMSKGFVVEDRDGRYTIETILLVEKEPIAGAPVLSVTPWHQLFDCNGNRIKEA